MLQHRRFDDLDAAMSEAGIDELSGALFDLGVSSHQFDSGERGFSYRHDAPLDMRMDTTEPTTAADVVNQASEGEIAHLLREYSDEKFAGRIARAIVSARPIHTTAELADIVASAIPAPARRRGGHPAKRTFQALRISLNKELEILPNAIDSAVRRTRRGGRVAVLSYHSGEDRIVKARFKQHATGGCECPSHLPCGCGALSTVRLVRVASKPSAEEQLSNPRSTSARLRVAEVI
jgi:16S rRNA (cytosine1402-N4)-methyltransferase